MKLIQKYVGIRNGQLTTSNWQAVLIYLDEVQEKDDELTECCEMVRKLFSMNGCFHSLPFLSEAVPSDSQGWRCGYSGPRALYFTFYMNSFCYLTFWLNTPSIGPGGKHFDLAANACDSSWRCPEEIPVLIDDLLKDYQNEAD